LEFLDKNKKIEVGFLDKNKKIEGNF